MSDRLAPIDWRSPAVPAPITATGTSALCGDRSCSWLPCCWQIGCRGVSRPRSASTTSSATPPVRPRPVCVIGANLIVYKGQQHGHRGRRPQRPPTDAFARRRPSCPDAGTPALARHCHDAASAGHHQQCLALFVAGCPRRGGSRVPRPPQETGEARRQERGRYSLLGYTRPAGFLVAYMRPRASSPTTATPRPRC